MADNNGIMLSQYDPTAEAMAAENIRAARLRNRITQMQLDEAAQNKSAQDAFYANPTAKMPSFAGGPQPASPLVAPQPQITPDNGLNLGLKAPNLPLQGQGVPNPLAGAMPAQQAINAPVEANEGAGETQGNFQEKVDKAQSVALGHKKLNSMGNMFMQALKNKDNATAEKLGQFVEKDENIQDLFEQANFKMTKETDPNTGDPLMGMTADWPKKSLMEMSQWKGGASLANLPDGARVKMVFDPVKHEVTKIETAPTEKGSEGILTDKQMSSDTELLYASKYGKTKEVRNAASDLYKTRQADKVAEAKATSEARAEGSAEAKKKMQGIAHNTFATWAPDEKEFMYQYARLKGLTSVKFAFGDKDSYTAFQQGFARWSIDKGLAPQDTATTIEMFSGLSKSQANQQKTIGMINAFVKNMGFQKARLDLQDKTNAVARTDIRLLNVPIRQALMNVKGSPQEAILTMYLTDISNDMAKLSTGSSASVREISAEAQERWNKVHDANLSIAARQAVVEETWKAAQGRLTTAQQALAETQQQMRDLGKLTKGDAGEEPSKEPTKETKWMDSLPMPKDNPKIHKGSKAKDDNGNTWVFNGTKWEKQ